MRRIQIHIEDDLDSAVAAEASRRGMSKAALIRACIKREVRVPSVPPDDPWEDMIGWADIDPAESIDDVVYGPKS